MRVPTFKLGRRNRHELSHVTVESCPTSHVGLSWAAHLEGLPGHHLHGNNLAVARPAASRWKIEAKVICLDLSAHIYSGKTSRRVEATRLKLRDHDTFAEARGERFRAGGLNCLQLCKLIGWDVIDERVAAVSAIVRLHLPRVAALKSSVTRTAGIVAGRVAFLALRIAATLLVAAALAAVVAHHALARQQLLVSNGAVQPRCRERNAERELRLFIFIDSSRPMPACSSGCGGAASCAPSAVEP